MKLKYQMRGLGIGMIVTALLMGVATGEKIPLSDAEIRARAIELGMVESDSLRLTDLQNVQPSSSPAGTQPSGEDAEPEETEPEVAGDASGDGDGPGEENTPETGDGPGEEDIPETGDGPGEEDNPETGDGPGEEDTPESGEETGEEGSTGVITFVIEPGMDSYSISRMIAEAGLVEDAGSFDNYLYELGASRYIRAGTYEIPAGTDMEEIAKIITGN